jgi:hypothetical protein
LPGIDGAVHVAQIDDAIGDNRRAFEGTAWDGDIPEDFWFLWEGGLGYAGGQGVAAAERPGHGGGLDGGKGKGDAQKGDDEDRRAPST